MFRTRVLGSLVLAFIAALALTWCRPTTAGPPDDGKERTPAELLVGTWSMVSTNGLTYPWWYSWRVEYRPDGTYRISSNQQLRVVLLTQREGKFEVTGTVVRHHYELNADDKQLARDTGQVPASPTWGDWDVLSVTRDELVLLCPSGSNSRVVYRRIN